MKTFLFAAIVFSCCSMVMAQSGPAGETPIVLWPNGAPGALGTKPTDIPTLTPFFPAPNQATGASIVVCPGGGYGGLAPHEGADYARWLNDQGVTAFVLKYRLGSAGYRHPIMMEDAARALRLVRSRAEEWKIDPKRIGIMGSSAGGHLASTLLTHFDAGNPAANDPIDRVSCRPDLGILCYPVISMAPGPLTHVGSRNNLLGPHPSPELMDDLSNERHVTAQTPPCFIFATAEDKTVPVENSLQFAVALSRAKVPFEIHIYEHGPHGLGLGTRDYNPAKWHPWTFECRRWLKERGFGQ